MNPSPQRSGVAPCGEQSGGLTTTQVRVARRTFGHGLEVDVLLARVLHCQPNMPPVSHSSISFALPREGGSSCSGPGRLCCRTFAILVVI